MKDPEGIPAGTSISTRWVLGHGSVCLSGWLFIEDGGNKNQVVRGFFKQNDPAYPRMSPEEMVSLPLPPYLCATTEAVAVPVPSCHPRSD
jgi:hypothetical protein